jgi:4-hydroxy-tetrahydrodipicolinate synthase
MAKFTTAVGTPLTEDERLDEEGLEKHYDDQAAHGYKSLLVAGTMGMMQLLTDKTYRSLVEKSVELWQGKGELLIGAGDAGFNRTKDRIEFLNEFRIDGVVILAPYFWTFGQEELFEYFSCLADHSKAPIYLYDIPNLLGVKLSMETILRLSEHPNIAGAKMSCEVDFSRRLIDKVDPSFRIIVAQINLVDVLLKHGIREHLDGVMAIAPGWVASLGKAADKGDWEKAGEYQDLVSGVKELVDAYGFPVFTQLMNARGLPGLYAPRPFVKLTPQAQEKLRDEPIYKRLVSEDSYTGVLSA